MLYMKRPRLPSWILISLCPSQTLIHVIDRKTGKEVEIKYYTGSMVVYHHVNAYQENGHLVFDVIAYKDSSLYDMFYLSKLKENPGKPEENYSKPNYKRFVLPLFADKVVQRTLWVTRDKLYYIDFLKHGCAGHCGGREHGEAQKHKSHCCEGERRQTGVRAGGAL